MKRKLASRPVGLRVSKWATPAIFALAGIIIFPGIPAEADVTSLMSDGAASSQSWRNYMVSAAAGSIHSEELVFAGSRNAGFNASGRGIVTDSGKRVAFSDAEKPVPATPDESRVTRSLKKGRIVAVDRIQPPKDFSAGSILDRQAHLLDPQLSEGQLTAFVKPDIKGKEIGIALAFHANQPKRDDFGVPAMLTGLITNETGDSLASAYADPKPDYALQSPFDSILVDTARKRFIPQIKGTDHAWAANVLPATVFSAKEQKCLAEAIYFESANEPLKGQAAVAQVVLNRVRNPTFPNSICGVVYQNEDWRNRCQFSFACDRIPDIVWSRSKFNTAKQVAMAVTAGKIYLADVGDSTHYHAVYVKPNWARTMKKVSKIGLHIFYRTYRGGWV
ncbi:cell wall hydrolase [Rhizobium setariae]|uniref:cell wall hydrolase n=1 Tax=Rhizobium setariae TaxID=2801340 RepID=UPI001AED2B58|nr:cell wall hydrolase [Rhizobium setariae]